MVATVIDFWAFRKFKMIWQFTVKRWMYFDYSKVKVHIEWKKKISPFRCLTLISNKVHMTTHIQSWLWLEYFSKYVEYFMLKVAFYGLLETVQMFSVEMLQVTKTSFAPSIWGLCSKDNLCVKTIFEQIRSLKLIEEKMSSSRHN